VLFWSVFTAATGSVQGISRLIFSNPGPEQWLWVLVVIRFLFGAGEAGAYPNIARALGRWFPYRERATAQSFIWLSSRLGGAFAPVIIGGLMVVGGSWQPAFWILGTGGILWAFLFFGWFRNRPEDQTRVNDAERNLIRSGPTAGGGIYDDTAMSGMPWGSLVSVNVLAVCVASFSVSFCFYFYITFLPQYLNDQFQVNYRESQWMAGLPLLLGGFACLAGGVLSDHAIRRTGSRRWGRSLVPVLAWSAAGACAFAVPQLGSASGVVFVLAAGFACQDLGVPAMWSLPVDMGGRFAATLGGWMNTAGALGGMLSPLIAAKMAIAHGWNSTFIVFGSVYFVGALAWLVIDASRPISSSAKRGVRSASAEC
jgi:MFS family permease